MIFLLDDSGKGINAIAKICVAADNVDAGEVVGSASLSMAHRLKKSKQPVF